MRRISYATLPCCSGRAADGEDRSGAGRCRPAVAAMTGAAPKSPRRPDPIVAVGLLTQRDLDVLGSGFRRSFPVSEDTAFDDLLHALDSIEAIRVPNRRD